MASTVSLGASFSREPAQPLFVVSDIEAFDVAPEGDRFLMKRRNPDSRVHEIQVVTNFLEVLRAGSGG